MSLDREPDPDERRPTLGDLSDTLIDQLRRGELTIPNVDFSEIERRVVAEMQAAERAGRPLSMGFLANPPGFRAGGVALSRDGSDEAAAILSGSEYYTSGRIERVDLGGDDFRVAGSDLLPVPSVGMILQNYPGWSRTHTDFTERHQDQFNEQYGRDTLFDIVPILPGGEEVRDGVALALEGGVGGNPMRSFLPMYLTMRDGRERDMGQDHRNVWSTVAGWWAFRICNTGEVFATAPNSYYSPSDGPVTLPQGHPYRAPERRRSHHSKSSRKMGE